jgi:hypothetical protein
VKLEVVVDIIERVELVLVGDADAQEVGAGISDNRGIVVENPGPTTLPVSIPPIRAFSADR